MCNAEGLTATLIHPPADLPADAQAFAGRLVGTINGATTALMISIGHRTHLFEAMRVGPATSAALAARAGLDERYVREWLGAMTTAGITTIDRASREYALPQAAQAFLGRDAPGGNMAAMFQFVAVLGAVESRIVDCFRHGGGVPYEAYDRFHAVMAEESQGTTVDALEAHILPLVPGLHDRLTAGIAVADVGCGSGRAIVKLASLYPNSRFTGYDLSTEATGIGRAEAVAKGLGNVAFVTGDATTLAERDAYDLVLTFDAVHDQAQPATVLSNIRRMLKPGGTYLCQDIDSHSDVADNADKPLAPFVYAISTMHCMTVSLAQGGVGLGAAWGEELAQAMFKDAGFDQIEVHRLQHDILNIYYVCR